MKPTVLHGDILERIPEVNNPRVVSAKILHIRSAISKFLIMFLNIYHSSHIALRGLLHSSYGHFNKINSALIQGHLRQASKMAKSSVEQTFDYFLVLDFEATCDDKTRLKPQVCKSNVYHLFVEKNLWTIC